MRFLFAGIIAGAAAVSLTSACGKSRTAFEPSCRPSYQAKELLGGGLEACLGAPFRVIAGSSEVQPSPDDSSDDLYLQVEDRRYWYRPAGGSDGVVFRSGATLGSVCVELPVGSADSVAATAAARLGGGAIVRDTRSLGSPVRRWEWKTGTWVHSDRDDWVCIGVAVAA